MATKAQSWDYKFEKATKNTYRFAAVKEGAPSNVVYLRHDDERLKDVKPEEATVTLTCNVS